MPPERANALFARLQNALQLFLAHYENLADFEIKGKIGFMSRDGEYNWAQYGKLPIHAPGWNFRKLADFKNQPLVSIHHLAGLCQTIENQVTPEVLDRHKHFKKSKGDEPMRDGKRFLVTPEMEEVLLAKYGKGWRSHFIWEGNEEATWLPEKYHRPGQEPLTELEWREGHKQVEARTERQHISPPQELPVKASKSPLKININLVDLASEPDSFVRQREVLFRYARYLKRVPTVQEGLKYLRDQNLFTGTWEENQTRRETRVRDILKWMAGTFDASKCAKGSVNVGKFDAWAAKKFPLGLIDGKRNAHVSTRFIAVFMAIAEFTLLINKNQDDSLPHDRAEELWKSLYTKGLIPVTFCARKWAACRDELERHGIIRITDREYHTGKAMQWEVGEYFPGLGLWRGTRHRGVGCLPKERTRTREQEHNTWLHQQSVESAVLNGWTLPRPPPGGKMGLNKAVLRMNVNSATEWTEMVRLRLLGT
jgi:hypothetical protein